MARPSGGDFIPARLPPAAASVVTVVVVPPLYASVVVVVVSPLVVPPRLARRRPSVFASPAAATVIIASVEAAPFRWWRPLVPRGSPRTRPEAALAEIPRAAGGKRREWTRLLVPHHGLLGKRVPAGVRLLVATRGRAATAPMRSRRG